MSNYFFVSQGKTFKDEFSGKYLWAPDDRVWHHQTMKEIKIGDIILNYVNQFVTAISIATKDCYNATKPFFTNGSNWNNEGLKVDVELYKLPVSIPKSGFIDEFYELQSSLPYGIVNTSRKINQIYLGKITKEMCECFF